MRTTSLNPGKHTILSRNKSRHIARSVHGFIGIRVIKYCSYVSDSVHVIHIDTFHTTACSPICLRTSHPASMMPHLDPLDCLLNPSRGPFLSSIIHQSAQPNSEAEMAFPRHMHTSTAYTACIPDEHERAHSPLQIRLHVPRCHAEILTGHHRRSLVLSQIPCRRTDRAIRCE